MAIRIIDIQSIKDAEDAFKRVGADKYAYPIMADKAITRNILIEKIDNRAANILKQEMLSIGGEAAVNRNVSAFDKGRSDVILLGTLKVLKILLKKISFQPYSLRALANDIREGLHNYDKSALRVKFGRDSVDLGKKAAVMGILNLTPDSFSDGGKFFDNFDNAFIHAEKMIEDGAGIIDIGGESSRPGAKPVSILEEKKRIIPIFKKLAKKYKVPLSVDTSKYEVARAALDSGAKIINDISGLGGHKGKMAHLAAQYDAAVVIMHMKGSPANMQDGPEYPDVIDDIMHFFEERIGLALSCGVKKEKIILDPGFGFGKTVAHNLQILKKFREFKTLGFPLMAGTSRKSFIGKITGVKDPVDRVAGSIVTYCYAIKNGANILRVHNVREAVQSISMAGALQ